MTRQTPASAQAVFRKRYKGHPNVMTPQPVRYGWKDGLAYELSEGEGLGRTPLYGVTVLRPDGTDGPEEANTSFKIRAVAEDWISNGFRERILA